MINSRKKGIAYEIELAKKFRDNGYKDCVTSRNESKRLDDSKVDLCFTGNWLVQAKAVEKLSPPLHDILSSMPKGDKIVFWKKNRKGSVVCMEEELFWKINRIILDNKDVNQNKEIE